ncbi:hypothetical protein WJX74_007289 [Apatococcus lobatus]|uniref:TOG domain-containing protein n=1 Tax=Apatococcus lobatus TaxID=904363 RepID=A0AAW1RQB3_9CHLO
MDWGELNQQLTGDTQQRITGLSHLEAFCQTLDLDVQEAGQLTDACILLLKDSNFKISHGALQILAQAARRHAGSMRPFLDSLLPSVVGKLGDMKAVVRGEAVACLEALMASVSCEAVLSRLGMHWDHRSWRIRQGLLQVAEHAIIYLAAGQMPPNECNVLLIQPAVARLDDADKNVRDAAMACLAALHEQLGDVIFERLQACSASETHMQALRAILIRDSQEDEAPAPMARIPSVHSVSSHVTNSRGSESVTSDHTSEASAELQALTLSPRNVTASSAHSLPSSRSAPASLQRKAPPRGPVNKLQTGDLPAVLPVAIGSEHDLKIALEKIAGQLDAQSDWTKRIASLQRFEGLVKGGAAMFPGFLDLLQRMREPLILQLADRRSAVSRQTCHLIGELATAMHASFEPMALTLFPELLKTLIITVQVMADAADACCSTIIQHCVSARLMSRICDVVKADKNAKLRQHCAGYLLKMMRGWPSSSWERCLPAVNGALQACCQDAQSTTRETGRATFAAYAAVLPGPAFEFLSRLDAGLQSRLRQALETSHPEPRSLHSHQAERPQTSSRAVSHRTPNSSPPPPPPRPLTAPVRAGLPLPAPKAAQHTAPAGSIPLTPRDRPLNRRASIAVPRPAAAQAYQVSDSLLQGDEHDEQPRRRKPMGRASLAGAALRIQLPNREDLDGAPLSGASAATARPTARRVSMLPPVPSAASHADRNSQRPTLPPAGSRGRAHSTGAPAASWGVPAHELPSIAVAISRALTCLESSKSADWKEKAEGLAELGQAVTRMAEERDRETGPPPETMPYVDRMRRALLSGVAEPHFRIAHAALACLQKLVEASPAATEPMLDQLLTQLFNRCCDPKPQVVEAAGNVLAACADALSLEAMLPAMGKALTGMKAVRPRLTILRFFVAQAAQCQQPAESSTLPTRTWVGKVSALLADKLPELRHAAAEALTAVYHQLSRDALLSSILSAAPALQLTLRQALSGVLPSLDTELQQASIAYSTGIPLGSPARRPPASPDAVRHPSQGSVRSSPSQSTSDEPVSHAQQAYLLSPLPTSGPSSMQVAGESHTEDPAWPPASHPVNISHQQQNSTMAEAPDAHIPDTYTKPGRHASSASTDILVKPDTQQHSKSHQQHHAASSTGYQLHAHASAQAAPSWQSAESEAAASRTSHPRIVVNSQPLLQATLQGSLHHTGGYPQPGSTPLTQPDERQLPSSWPILPPTQSQRARPAGQSVPHHLQHAGSQQPMSDAHSILPCLQPAPEALMAVSQAAGDRSGQNQVSMGYGKEAGMASRNLSSLENAARDGLPGSTSASGFQDVSRMASSNGHAPVNIHLAQPGLPEQGAHAASSMPAEHVHSAVEAHQQQASGPRQPLAARAQQETRASGEYDHLLPISPISGRRMPGQENAGPGAAYSLKQQGPPAFAQLSARPSVSSSADDLRHSQESAQLPQDVVDITMQAAHAICAKLRSGREGEVEQACYCIRHMATHQADWLQRHLEALVPAVTQSCCHGASKVPMQVLEMIESQSEASSCIEALQPELFRLSSTSSSAEAAHLQVIIKSVTRLVPKLAYPEVTATTILPALCSAFHHPSADVRKAVVFCLVEFWQKVGHSLTPAMSALTPPQLKLVTIYMNRRQRL